MNRARQLARQLGCDVWRVDEVFRARFQPTPTTTSPSFAANISYQPPSAIHSRLPSTGLLTMAEEQDADDAGKIADNATQRRVRGLSSTLGNALSMSQLVQQRLQQEQQPTSREEGYDADSPLNGSIDEPSLLMSLRATIKAETVTEEADMDEQAGSCITYL